MRYLLLVWSCLCCISCYAEEKQPLVYLKVVNAEASSFDQTAEWSPEPNAMNAFDGQMRTRWASDSKEKEPWILCDFGQEVTVSNAIIRWERAFSTRFRLYSSNDKSSWQDVYNDPEGKGGINEISFSPVTCRYIKLVAEERVNSEWGISIWEIEFYGPKDKNPQATISKEDYLKQRRKEIEDAIQKYREKPVSLKDNPLQKGVNITYWEADQQEMQQSDAMLLYVKELGLNAVSLIVPGYQDNVKATKIYINEDTKGDIPSNEKLVHLIGTAHEIGLRVMLKPHIDMPKGEPRTEIEPSDDWFKSYEEYIIPYAKLAEENHVELFSVGTELEKTTKGEWGEKWKEIIQKIKEVYHGSVTYSANWTEYSHVTFWDTMDYVGIDGYFPLSDNPKPSLEDLTKGWKTHADVLQKWLEENKLLDKGLLFTEIGYTSTAGTAKQPWVSQKGGEISQQEQADAYQAFFDVFSKLPWYRGFYFWHLYPLVHKDERGFPIQGKLAEKVIKQAAQ